MCSILKINNLQELLKPVLKTNKFIKYYSKYLTAPGENYGSAILAVDVLYEEETEEKILKLVAKMCPPTEILKEAFLCDLTFKKEIQAYISAIPAIEKFQKESNIPDKTCLDFFPKCYGARYNLNDSQLVDENAVLLLENLKVHGYSVADRMSGFDLQTSQMILKNLAELHATVIAIRMLKTNEFKRNILPSIKTINNAVIMIDGFIAAAMQILETIEDCKPFLQNIKSMMEERIHTVKGLLFPGKSNFDFYTMVHNDFWTNNVMILKNEDNEPIKVRMVDFQLSDYGSAVRDLLFFIYTSVEINVCENKFDSLIKYYYECFFNCIKQYDNNGNFLNKFTWELFLEEVNDVAPYELFHILFMLKPIFAERGSIQSLDSINVEEFERIDNLGNVYKQKLKQIVLSYASKNWIL